VTIHPLTANRKTPWYDITSWFSSSSSESKAEPKRTPEPTNTPAPTSTPPMNPVVAQPIPQHGNEPAWKWYGYTVHQHLVRILMLRQERIKQFRHRGIKWLVQRPARSH